MIAAAPHVLVLGGTAEGRGLADALAAEGWAVTTSLAGRTSSPVAPSGQVRVGGFGDVAGLTAWLRDRRPLAVVDATHPFAATMSAHAVAACAAADVPLVRLARPSWRATRPEAAGWTWAADHERAATVAAALVGGRLGGLSRPGAPAGLAASDPHAGVLLTVGRQATPAYVPALGHARVVARVAEARALRVPERWLLLARRGPFAVADELQLMTRHGIRLLVSKDSGGEATAAKLEAAAGLGVAVVMVARPAAPPAPSAPHEVGTISAAVAWCATRVAEEPRRRTSDPHK